MTTALALARYGYASVVVERHAQRLDQPKAHVLNPRALEIFRQMELDLTPLRKSGLQPEDADVIRFATAMTGTEFGGIQMAQDIEHQHSPEQLFNVPQPCLEEYLLELALATGKVTYLRMHEWQSCEETLGGTIVSRILVRRENVTKSIQSKYLVGCDGAKARTRDSLEIAFDPIMGDQEVTLHYVSVHFNADLSHMKSGLLWFLLAPPCVGVFIAYNRKNSWVFFIQYDPSTQSKETLTSEYLRGLVFQVSASGAASAPWGVCNSILTKCFYRGSDNRCQTTKKKASRTGRRRPNWLARIGRRKSARPSCWATRPIHFRRREVLVSTQASPTCKTGLGRSTPSNKGGRPTIISTP